MKKTCRCLLALSLITLIISSCSKNLNNTPQPTTDSLNSISSLGNSLALRKKPSKGSPTTTAPTTPASSLNVGDGKSALTIDGSKTAYAAGSQIIVKPGTYPNGITIQNLSGVTIIGTGVILDGLSQSKNGYYNCLNLSNLTNVTVSGFTTQNNGYKMLNINSKMVGLTLDKLTFNNCLQGISLNVPTIVWNGTDNTVALQNFSITNSTFTNCGGTGLGGNIANGQVINLTKNFVFSGNTITGGNPGDALFGGAVDGFNIFNNTISNVNLNLTNDNRVLMMVGNGDAHDNKFTNIQGHSIGIWSVSFGSTVKTSHITSNTCIGSLKYSSFEFQEFAAFAIKGLTTKADLIVDSNTCGNLNTEHHTEFNAGFIDNYEYGVMGGKVTLTNNKGYNFFPKPVNNIVWNLAQPAVFSGNTYSATAL